MTHRRPAIALLSLAALAACQLEPDQPKPSERASLGEAAYGVLHTTIAASGECRDAKLAELERSRAELIAAIDHVVTNELANQLPGLVGGAIAPLVDSGDLPRLTDALADTASILVDDTFDPERGVLAALVQAIRAPSVIDSEHAYDLVAGLLASGNAGAGLHALAALAQEPDGTSTVAGSVLDLAARTLGGPAEPSMCGAVDAAMLRADLLDTRGFEDDPALGRPALAVRAGANGAPARRVDPASGALVDDTYDAKKTLLGASLRLVRDALAARLHVHVAPLVDAVLGAPRPCSDGAGCFAYGGADHPLADLVHLLLEAARYDRAATLALSWARALRDQPQRAEDTLVALGRVIVTVDGLAPRLTTDRLLALVIELSPLVSQVLETSPTARESLADLLVGVVGELLEHLADPRYQRVIVDLLPVLQAVVTTGALATIVELDQTLQALPATDGNGSVLSATMDGLAYLVRPRTVATRQGPVANSSIAIELLDALRVVDGRVVARGAMASRDALLDFVLGYLTRTTTVAGKVRLANRDVVPTLAAALATIGHLVDLPRATYTCVLGELQRGATTALTGRNFATLVRVVGTAAASPHGDALMAWVVTVLDPTPAEPEHEAYGPLVGFAATAIDSPLLYGAVDEVLRYAGEVAKRRRDDGGEILRVLDELLLADRGAVVPQLLRNLTAVDARTGERPLRLLLGVYRRLDALRDDGACTPVERTLERADLERIVRSAAGFLRDEQGGLRAIYRLIGQRAS
jgi:hypothetical protein